MRNISFPESDIHFKILSKFHLRSRILTANALEKGETDLCIS